MTIESVIVLRCARWARQTKARRRLIRFLANAIPFLVLGAVLAWMAYTQGWGFGVRTVLIRFAIAAVISRVVVTKLLYFLVNRPRPFDVLAVGSLLNRASGHSFPSGHAMFFFAIAFAAVPFSSMAAMILFAFAGLNGLARIAAGVHWPSDILGSILLAAFGATLATFIV